MASAERIGNVVAVCLSEAKAYPKYPQEKVRISPHGIEGDAHAGAMRPSHRNPDVLKPNDRAVSIVAKEVMDDVNAALGLDMKPGDFNENILVEGLGDLGDLRKGDQLIFENGLVIDVMDQNPPCKKLDAHNGRGLIKSTIGRVDGQIYNRRGILGIPQQATELTPNVAVRIQRVAE
jgi:MOSC domain-containing protein YiiM